MSTTDIALKFISDNNGKSLEAEDSSALDQCMDEAFKYLDVLGIDRATIRHQYAYQILNNLNDYLKKYFDIFQNTATFIPQTGDVAVFKAVTGIPVGHIDIVGVGSNINDLVSFAQNWDTIHYYHIDANGNHIPYCRTVVHYGYYGVGVFLRPKSQTITGSIEKSVLKGILDGAGSDGDKLIKIRALL